jgi:hypothetical protein
MYRLLCLFLVFTLAQGCSYQELSDRNRLYNDDGSAYMDFDVFTGGIVDINYKQQSGIREGF